jgi:hypothetical protein
VIFSCENQDAATREFMARTGVECRAKIGLVTVPLYTQQHGKTILFGSGVLLQVAEKHFIISAGHNFDIRKMLDLPLWVTDGVVGNRLLSVGQVLVRSSETIVPYHRTDELFDMAVCELSGEVSTQIAAQKRFLRLNDVDPWDRQEPRSWYMVYGYPTKLSPPDEATQSINANAVAFATFIYCDERGELDNFDMEVRIALDFNEATMTDDGGQPATPPDPDGMSGCGIWRLVAAGTDTRRWNLDDVKLVAINHGWRKRTKVLVGTRIRYALQMIYRNHLDLRPAIDFHIGPNARNL